MEFVCALCSIFGDSFGDDGGLWVESDEVIGGKRETRVEVAEILEIMREAKLSEAH